MSIRILIEIVVVVICLGIYGAKFIRYLVRLVRNKANTGANVEVQIDIPDEIVAKLFPGGEAEIDAEVKKLRTLLQNDYPKDLVKFVYVGTTVFYKQSESKNENVIIAHILDISDNLIAPEDASLIYDFIYTKVVRAMFGPVLREDNIEMLKGMIQFNGHDDVEPEEETADDIIEEDPEESEATAAIPLDIPEEVIAATFPGGENEIEKETTKLYTLLQKSHAKDLIRKILVGGATFFSQSDDKSERKLIAYLKQISNAKITSQEGKKIHDFIYTRALRIYCGTSENDPQFRLLNDIKDLTGSDADEIHGGKGFFGLTLENPVPVKGIVLSEYYLSRLRTEEGERITWERIGSNTTFNIKQPIDIYRILDLNEAEIARIYISPYHKRVSNKAPSGFRLLFKSDLDLQASTFTSQTDNQPAESNKTYVEKETLEPASAIYVTTDADGNEETQVLDPRVITSSLALLAASAALTIPDQEKAKQELQEGIAMLDSFPGPDDANITDLLLKAAQLSGQLEDSATAERLLERALKAQLNRKKTDQEILAGTQYDLGVLLFTKQQFGRAEALLRQSLQIRQTLLGAEHELTAGAILALGLVLQQQGSPTKETENLFRQARTLFQKLYGDNYPEKDIILDNLARILLQQGKTQEAIPLAEEAYAIRQKDNTASASFMAQCMSTLAVIYKRLGKLTEAENLQRQLLSILEKAYGTGNQEFGAELGNLADTLMEKGEEEEARELFYRALYIKEEYLPADHPSIAHTLINLAGLHANKREFTKAEPLAKRAYQIRAKAFGDLHPETQQSFGLLQQIRADKNR